VSRPWPLFLPLPLCLLIDEQTLIHTGLGFTALFTLFLCVVVPSQFSPYTFLL
jgi:hypothetical protein